MNNNTIFLQLKIITKNIINTTINNENKIKTILIITTLSIITTITTEGINNNKYYY